MSTIPRESNYDIECPKPIKPIIECPKPIIAEFASVLATFVATTPLNATNSSVFADI